MRHIHFFCRRVKDQLRAGLLREAGVPLNVARIACEIFAGAKLRRVDEIADHDAVVFCGRPLDQALVSFVQKAHRRHQPHAEALPPPLSDLLSYLILASKVWR